MWGGELDLLAVDGTGIPEQARRLEIFLDCLLAHADQGLSLADAHRTRRAGPPRRPGRHGHARTHTLDA